jgi:hypothetical protein
VRLLVGQECEFVADVNKYKGGDFIIRRVSIWIEEANTLVHYKLPLSQIMNVALNLKCPNMEKVCSDWKDKWFVRRSRITHHKNKS